MSPMGPLKNVWKLFVSWVRLFGNLNRHSSVQKEALSENDEMPQEFGQAVDSLVN